MKKLTEDQERLANAAAAAAQEFIKENSVIQSALVLLARADEIREIAEGQVIVEVEKRMPDISEENRDFVVDVLFKYAISHNAHSTGDMLYPRKPDA